MTIEVIPPERTAPNTAILLHTLTFPDVLEAKKPVSDRCGYLVAGPDRRGANALNPITLWRTWQRDVQTATLRPGAWPVPAKVQEYFQRTKHMQAPPKDTHHPEIFGVNPSAMKEELVFTDLAPQEDTLDLDLGLNLDALAPQAPANPCSGKLANPPRFATSFSGMESFLQCAFKWAAEKYYKTVPYEESEAAKQGNRGHKTAENYALNKLDGGARPIEAEMLKYTQRYLDFFLSLPGAEILVEKEMCCTKDLKPCGWKDWNTVWFRGKGDLLVIKDRKLIIPDWKFGKKKDDTFQIEVMVALADIWYGDKWDTADGKLIFVKEPDPAKALVSLPKLITKADIPAIWEKIFAITNRMEQACEAGIFRKSTSGLCKQWCGNLHCEHNGRR
jgi:hypothetical protein